MVFRTIAVLLALAAATLGFEERATQKASGGIPSPPTWEAEFANPPAGYGLGVYWWWFGPAQTKQEVARELNVMHRAGISYVLIFPLYPISADNPAEGIRNFRYLSPEFLDVLGYATATAKSLGIAADILIGTGWPYGGPSITPELSAQRLRVAIQKVDGSGSVRIPSLQPHERLVAAWLVKSDGTHTDLPGALDETEQFRRSETIAVDQASGLNTLMAFIQSPTGMQVKRAALGAEGLVMDHLNRKAVETYLNSVASKLLPSKPGTLRALHSDSLEVFREEWTPGFLAEFSKRRGYDLKPYLPALVSDIGPLTADVRYDYWRTVGELAFDHYVRPLHQWCRAHGVSLQSESYGTPPVDLASFSEVDYPMGESLNWKAFTPSRWASSAAHQLGKNLTAAEAYTWLRQPRYITTLQDLKVGSDLHFICGINKLVAHGYAYSPPAAGVPGWGYYASVMFNDNNTWWPYFHLLSDYVRRVSYALRLGKPKADVALYLPEDDVMANQPVGQGLRLNMATDSQLRGNKERIVEFGLPAAYASESPVIQTILTSGYTFDGFDRSILRPDLKTGNGLLEVGDAAYRIVVLPDLTGISLPILEKLADFCRSGGTVIATRRLPTDAYGVRDRAENYARVRKIVKEMFGSGALDQTRRHEYGRGLAVFTPDETTSLSEVLGSLAPDIRVYPPDPNVFFLHRGQGPQQVYFLTNTSAERKLITVQFRDGKGKPRLWNPMDGTIHDAPEYSTGKSGTLVPLQLEPYGSTLVAFDGTAGTPGIISTNLPVSSLVFDKSRNSWFARVSQSGSYYVETRAGKQAFKVRLPVLPIRVSGPWSLKIGTRGTGVALDRLESWTEIPQYRFFSGRGDYRVEVKLPANALKNGHGLWLDLGDVREIAAVSVNGHPAGVCWKLPYRLDITRWAEPGKNTISVSVTNLLINRVLGQPDPDFSGLSQPLRFPKPGEKRSIHTPLPSGLLGPVQINPYIRVEIPSGL